MNNLPPTLPPVQDSELEAFVPAGAASDNESRVFRQQRRVLVAASPALTGLDRIEATQTSVLEWKLTLHFLTGSAKPRPVPAALSPIHIRLSSRAGGGLELPSVVSAAAVEDTATAQAVLRFEDARQARLAERAGPFQLTLSGLASLDRFFSQAWFRFGPPVEQSRGVAGRDTASADTAERLAAPPTDYLARDYESFRRLMLDTLGARVRGWTERNPADLGVTLVEALAYAGDYLSYYQDAVATEAYLQTARLRSSVRRHTRLIDYALDEGANARVWVRIEVSGDDAFVLPRGTQLLTESGELPTTLIAGSWQHQQALGGGAVIFETVADTRLHPRHGELELYTWGAVEYALAAGTTAAALAGTVAGLEAGDVLLLEETDLAEAAPGNRGDEARGPARCHLVRLSESGTSAIDPATGEPYTWVRWFTGDALPFPLAVSRRGPGGTAVACAAAHGNLLLADEGQTVSELLAPVMDAAAYRPQLERFNLTFRAVPDPGALARQPAAVALVQDPAAVLPALTLLEMDPDCSTAGELELRQGPTWYPRHDLLGADRFGREFVVEMSEERRAQLRFGDGRHGRLPPVGARFEAYYRVGGGPSGNVGTGTIRHVVSENPRITGASNPLPASGGRAWERIEKARVMAPTAFHTQRRCVTADDFVTTAKLHPDVLAAAARLRWTGTWNTAYVYLQRRGGFDLDERFRRELEEIYAGRLVAGLGLELRAPRWVALALRLRIGVALHQDPGVVRNRLEDTFSDRRLPGGGTGFFYPDAHSFGEPIYAADLVARASAVAGVASVVVEKFARRGEPSGAALEQGTLELGPLEIALVRNQPATPQLGVIEFVLGGAR